MLEALQLLKVTIYNCQARIKPYRGGGGIFFHDSLSHEFLSYVIKKIGQALFIHDILPRDAANCYCVQFQRV